MYYHVGFRGHSPQPQAAVVPLICGFAVHGFSYRQSTVVPNINEKFQKVATISFKLHTLLSNTIQFCVASLHSTEKVNHPFVQPIPLSGVSSYIPVSHLAAILIIKSTVEESRCWFKEPLVT